MHPDQDPRREPIVPFPYKTAAMLVFSTLLIAGCSREVQGSETPETQFTEPRVTLDAVNAIDFLTETPHASATPVSSKTWTFSPELTEEPDPTATEQILPTPAETEQVEREVGCAAFRQVFCDLISESMLKPLSEEEITRLYTEDGNALPTGYLEDYDWFFDYEGSEIRSIHFSGIVRGVIPYGEYGYPLLDPTLNHPAYGFGVVIEWERDDGSAQYLVFSAGASNDSYPLNVFVSPQGDFDRREPVNTKEVGLTNEVLASVYADSRMIGHQVVIREVINYPWFQEDKADFFRHHDERLLALSRGELVDDQLVLNVQDRMFDKEIVEEITGIDLP